MTETVWDASALLALLNEEAGSEGLVERLPRAVMSSVNLSEVVAKLTERGMPEAEVRDVLEALPLSVRSFDAAAAFRAGALRPRTRQAGLSLGDRACLALADALGLPALTTDRAWRGLDLEVQVEVLR